MARPVIQSAIDAIATCGSSFEEASERLRQAVLDPSTTRDELRAVSRALAELMLQVARIQIATLELPPPAMNA